jgi:hypothetical protein
MSVRLQVLLPEGEMEELRAVARQCDLTVSEWVRRVLREARDGFPRRSVEDKLAAIRQAGAHRFPTGDIEQMLAEIESRYPTALPE